MNFKEINGFCPHQFILCDIPRTDISALHTLQFNPICLSWNSLKSCIIIECDEIDDWSSRQFSSVVLHLPVFLVVRFVCMHIRNVVCLWAIKILRGTIMIFYLVNRGSVKKAHAWIIFFEIFIHEIAKNALILSLMTSWDFYLVLKEVCIAISRN